MEMKQPERVKIDHAESGIKGELSISIYKNQIVVTFESSIRISNLYTLRNIVSDVVGSIVHIAGLSCIVGYEIEMISATEVQTGVVRVFGMDEPGFSIGDNEARTISISSMLRFCHSEALFRRAITDFKNAIRVPADTGFYCYRAIESLLNILRDRYALDKPAAIAKLNSDLNLNASCIEKLRTLGGGPRHGKAVWISGEDRVRSLEITRESLIRFHKRYGENSKEAFDSLGCKGR